MNRKPIPPMATTKELAEAGVKRVVAAPTKRRRPFAANLASTKLLEADGWTVERVEQTIPRTFIKRDFGGFADLIAYSPSRGIMAIQATGGGNMAARASKTRTEPRSALWLASGGRIQIHDWRKRAGRKLRECVVLEITNDGAPA